jgi:hypothetical protein
MLPYKLGKGSATILNNKIHILGGEYEPRKHYKVPTSFLAIY